jgi:phage shock protein C
MAAKRLYRSKTDKQVAGICGGLAEYFDIDPVLVRIGFAVAGVMGWGVVLYFIMWFVVPEEGAEAKATSSAVQIAEERYARGEITDEELERIRKDLQGNS